MRSHFGPFTEYFVKFRWALRGTWQTADYAISTMDSLIGVSRGGRPTIGCPIRRASGLATAGRRNFLVIPVICASGLPPQILGEGE
jgi:hypothetical protein